VRVIARSTVAGGVRATPWLANHELVVDASSVTDCRCGQRGRRLPRGRL